MRIAITNLMNDAEGTRITRTSALTHNRSLQWLHVLKCLLSRVSLHLILLTDASFVVTKAMETGDKGGGVIVGSEMTQFCLICIEM